MRTDCRDLVRRLRDCWLKPFSPIYEREYNCGRRAPQNIKTGQGLMRFLRLAATLWWALSIFALPAAADNFRLLVLDDAFVKWGEPVLGTGAVVTYGFAARETINEDARN